MNRGYVQGSVSVNEDFLIMRFRHPPAPSCRHAHAQHSATGVVIRDSVRDRNGAGIVPNTLMRRDYAVVTHVVDAASASVLISSGGNGRFVASAEADLKAGLSELANAKAGFSRLVSRNVGTELLALGGLTPLFKLFGFKRGGLFWGSPKVAPLGYGADSDPGELAELAPAESDSE